MTDRKYVCYWNSDPEVIELHDFDFFSPDVGYRPDNIDLIDDMLLGESVDLSDGIGQIHFVMRVN